MAMMRSRTRDAAPSGIWLPAAVPPSGLDYFWQAEPQWLALWLAILAAIIAVAWYAIGKTRPKSAQKEQPASEWLTKCRESHAKGVLSDEEFRTIKTKLARQLQDELNDNDEKG